MAVSRIRTGRKEGKYRVRIQPINEDTGKVVSIPSQIANTRQDAKKLEREMWNEYYSGKYSAKSANELAQAINSYCEGEHDEGRWNNVTYRDWNYTCRLVADYFGNIKVRDVKEN